MDFLMRYPENVKKQKPHRIVWGKWDAESD